MQGGSLQNSRIRMDRTFQDKIEHETKQLKKRGLARQFHFTNLKLSEKNEKRKISDIGAMLDVNGEKLS